jgi:hypothetical protein
MRTCQERRLMRPLLDYLSKVSLLSRRIVRAISIVRRNTPSIPVTPFMDEIITDRKRILLTLGYLTIASTRFGVSRKGTTSGSSKPSPDVRYSSKSYEPVRIRSTFKTFIKQTVEVHMNTITTFRVQQDILTMSIAQPYHMTCRHCGSKRLPLLSYVSKRGTGLKSLNQSLNSYN